MATAAAPVRWSLHSESRWRWKWRWKWRRAQRRPRARVKAAPRARARTRARARARARPPRAKAPRAACCPSRGGEAAGGDGGAAGGAGKAGGVGGGAGGGTAAQRSPRLTLTVACGAKPGRWSLHSEARRRCAAGGRSGCQTSHDPTGVEGEVAASGCSRWRRACEQLVPR